MRFHPQCMAFWIGKGRCFSQKFRDRWSSGKQTMVFTPKCPTIILRKQTCSAWACSIDGSTSLRENRDHRTQKWDGFNWALECDQNKTSPLAWNPYHPHNLFLNYLNLQFYWSKLCQLLKFIPPVFGWSNPTSRTKFGKLTICMMGFCPMDSPSQFHQPPIFLRCARNAGAVARKVPTEVMCLLEIFEQTLFARRFYHFFFDVPG